jgi:metalloendopeptidase OMA1, mitochondrial
MNDYWETVQGVRETMVQHFYPESPQPDEHEDGRVMPRLTRRGFMLGGTVLLLCGCATTPITGRRQLMLVSEAQESALGVQAYQQVLQKEPVTQEPRYTEPVHRVTRRLEGAANRPDLRWEVSVIDEEKTVNAFALPGGKIGVYTGIFPIAQTEGGLAIIMGHELGHVIARHGAERMSQHLGAQLLGSALAVGLHTSPHANTIMAAYGLTAQVGVLLPYSRLQESEADRIGLVLAAKAGYEPQAAIGVWQRMAKLSGRRPPPFLSTHPTPESRIEDIKQFLPQAMAQFRSQGDDGDAPLPTV